MEVGVDAAPTPFAQLHSAGRLKPHEAEGSWPKIRATGA